MQDAGRQAEPNSEASILSLIGETNAGAWGEKRGLLHCLTALHCTAALHDGELEKKS